MTNSDAERVIGWLARHARLDGCSVTSSMCYDSAGKPKIMYYLMADVSGLKGMFPLMSRRPSCIAVEVSDADENKFMKEHAYARLLEKCIAEARAGYDICYGCPSDGGCIVPFCTCEQLEIAVDLMMK